MELALKKERRITSYNLLISILMYGAILLASVFGTWILTYEGFPAGDDVAYHFSNIYDMYNQLKSGNLSSISASLASGLGFGKQLFYSPFSHLSTAVLGIMLEPLGVTLLQAFKLNLFLSVFLSGIIMYRFGLHISGKRGVALAAALIYILYPYRYFDMFCRIAIAEAYAFLFMPLFFMGLYDLVHLKDERMVCPFVEIIIGGALLFLTHNITAAYAYIFGVAYLAFNYKAIYKLIKNNKIVIPFAIVACILLLGITAGTLFGVLELYQTKMYNCSFEVRMWTNKDYLAGRSDFEWYSGILNLKYFNSFESGITTKSTVLDGLYYGLCIFVVVLADALLSKIKGMKFFSDIIAICLGLMLMLLFIERTEVRLAVYLFMVCYFVVSMENGFEALGIKEALIVSVLAIIFFMVSMLFAVTAMFILVIAACIGFGCYSVKMGNELGKNMDFWFTISALCFTLILITTGVIWYIMPGIMRNIQFPWRLWAYMSLFVSILSAMVLKEAKSKMLRTVSICGACFLLCVSQAIPEKTIAYNNRNQEKSTDSWKYEIDDSMYTNWGSIGACKEYFPYMYYGSDGYTSKYSNSLYTEVKKYINYSSHIGKEHSLSPVVLEGDADVTLVTKEAPYFEMTVEVKEADTLIQLPLIYYPGYSVYVEDSNGNEEKLTALEVDGLVSFKLDSGSYRVYTKYEGTSLMKLGNLYQQISIYALVVFCGVLLICEDKKRRKKYYTVQ